MPEPLKNLYTAELVNAVADAVQSNWPSFDRKGFADSVFEGDWIDLELKQRMARLTQCLHDFLSLPYAEAIDILAKAIESFEGFEYMFFPGFIETYGMEDFDASVSAMARMTPYASAEFAVRPFIKRYPEIMMQQMLAWTQSANEHHRRLASEGCRPRLPWAMALPEYQRDPGPVLPILESLKNDPSEYVRRSVANNLNDIAKDHPDLVSRIAADWLGDNKDTDRLVRHACRTLLKQGHPQVMELFGFKSPDQLNVADLQLTRRVAANGTIEFSFRLSSSSGSLGQVRVDYAIGFLRNNGSLSEKVFKLSESKLDDNSRVYTKSFSFKPITTRRYYSGRHSLAILVNGVELARDHFILLDQ